MVSNAIFNVFKEKIAYKSGVNILVGLLIVVGAFLRLYGLGKDSLWFDEIDHVTTAALPLHEMFQALIWHASPPLDYLIIHFWLSVGHGDFFLRFPAAFFSIATIYVLYRVGTILHSPEVGVGAAILLTFSLPSIAYAQEVRMYSLFIFLTTLLLWQCAVLAEKPTSWKEWLVVSIIALLLMYTHYYAGLMLFGLALLWLGISWQAWRRWLVRGFVSLSFVAVAFLPWIPILLRQAERRGGYLPYALAREDYWKTLPYYLSGGLFIPFSALYLLLFILGFLYCLRQRRAIAGLLVAVMAVPAILAYVVPALSQTVTARNMLFLLPPYLIGTAIGIRFLVEMGLKGVLRSIPLGQKHDSLRFWLTIVGAVMVAFVLSFGALHEFYVADGGWWMKGERTEWRQTARYLQRAMQPNEMILLGGLNQRYLLSYYLDPSAIQGQVVSDFAQNPENHLSGALRTPPMLTTQVTPTSSLWKTMYEHSGAWILYPDSASLQAIGLDPTALEPVGTRFNIPLAYLSQNGIYDNLTLLLNDRLRDGWAGDVYSFDNSRVRWMASLASLSLPVQSAEENTLRLSFFAPPDVAGAELLVLFEGNPAPPVRITEGWQSATIPLPTSLSKEELLVELQVINLPPAVGSYPIGTTTVESPVSIVVQSAGHDGENSHARFYIDGILRDRNQAGGGYGRGYNLLALDPISGEMLDWQVFDTHQSRMENYRLAAWVGNLPKDTIVAGAVKDEGSRLLNQIGVLALQQLGCAIDLRGHYRQAHAFVGVKGAAPNTGQESGLNREGMVVVGSDRQNFLLALSKIALQ